VSPVPTLRELRLRRLWSQRELARRAGVAEGTIISIETGKRLPRLLTMRRIADGLEIDWSEISEFRSAIAELEENPVAEHRQLPSSLDEAGTEHIGEGLP
jgi:transcriptional regulator with XRE-family HTH domain